jgi:hypothetical protein
MLRGEEIVRVIRMMRRTAPHSSSSLLTISSPLNIAPHTRNT